LAGRWDWGGILYPSKDERPVGGKKKKGEERVRENASIACLLISVAAIAREKISRPYAELGEKKEKKREGRGTGALPSNFIYSHAAI